MSPILYSSVHYQADATEEPIAHLYMTQKELPYVASRQTSCCIIHNTHLSHRFLRGKCDKTDKECPFSHSLSKEKVKTCKSTLLTFSQSPSSSDASLFILSTRSVHKRGLSIPSCQCGQGCCAVSRFPQRILFLGRKGIVLSKSGV